MLKKEGDKQGYYYQDEQSMIISKKGSTLDFGFISLIPRLGVHCTPALLKPRTLGQLPSSNFRIGKSNTPTNLPSFSKYCVNVHPLYKILGLNYSKSERVLTV